MGVREKRKGPRTELDATQTFEGGMGESIGCCKGDTGKAGRANRGVLRTVDTANQMRTAERPAGFANDLTSDLVPTSFLRLVDKGKETIDGFIMKVRMTSQFLHYPQEKNSSFVKLHVLIWAQKNATAAAQRKMQLGCGTRGMPLTSPRGASVSSSVGKGVGRDTLGSHILFSAIPDGLRGFWCQWAR